jgi:hypothetical protein
VAENLPSKHKALHANPRTAKNKTKKAQEILKDDMNFRERWI